jgi:hypothetical protein
MNYEQFKIEVSHYIFCYLLKQDIQIWRFVSHKNGDMATKNPIKKDNFTKWREKISPHEKRAGN